MTADSKKKRDPDENGKRGPYERKGEIPCKGEGCGTKVGQEKKGCKNENEICDGSGKEKNQGTCSESEESCESEHGGCEGCPSATGDGEIPPCQQARQKGVLQLPPVPIQCRLCGTIFHPPHDGRKIKAHLISCRATKNKLR